MFKLIILEGARGTGKSTIAFKLRQILKNSTLINFTGFDDDNVEGLDKIKNYYHSWLDLFRKFKWNVPNQIIICDRFFPSEMVYSFLYKSYDFDKEFLDFTNILPTLADEIYLLNFLIEDEKELNNRLIRDKVPFGKVKESVSETLKQQSTYKNVFEKMRNVELPPLIKDSMNFIDINTTNKPVEFVLQEVLKSINETQ
ncbi:hypothetical protein V1503_19425 [Bacillus sp. SCS-151]|uniref:hypothetical protein n=1 Tax=Nanhaiella sioensis TaxID=3115293 RepID=UPI00397D95B6